MKPLELMSGGYTVGAAVGELIRTGNPKWVFVLVAGLLLSYHGFSGGERGRKV